MGALRTWERNPLEARDPREALAEVRHAINQADKALQQVAANPTPAEVLQVRHLTTLKDLAAGTVREFEQRRQGA